MATITTERLQWLWNQFSHNNPTQLTNFLQPPPQNFEIEILWLTQRYITVLPKRVSKHIQPNNLHHTLHPVITKILIESFKITHSYYSSPFTYPTQITQYYSPHDEDKIFWLHGACIVLHIEGHWPSIPHGPQYSSGSHPLGQNGSQGRYKYNHLPNT